MVTSCKISKNPNGAGKYSCQYVDDKRFKICCFNSYEDGVSYAFFVWGLSKERHLQNSVILERE